MKKLNRRNMLRRMGYTTSAVAFSNLLAQAFESIINDTLFRAVSEANGQAMTQKKLAHFYYEGGTNLTTTMLNPLPNGIVDVNNGRFLAAEMGYFNKVKPDGSRAIETIAYDGFRFTPFWGGDFPIKDGGYKNLTSMIDHWISLGPACIGANPQAAKAYANHPEAKRRSLGNDTLHNGESFTGKIASKYAAGNTYGALSLLDKEVGIRTNSSVKTYNHPRQIDPVIAAYTTPSGNIFFDNNQVKSLINQATERLKLYKKNVRNSAVKNAINVQKAMNNMNITAEVIRAEFNSAATKYYDLLDRGINPKGRMNGRGIPGITDGNHIMNSADGMYLYDNWDIANYTTYPYGASEGGNYMDYINFVNDQYFILHYIFAMTEIVLKYNLAAVAVTQIDGQSFNMNPLPANIFANEAAKLKWYGGTFQSDPHYANFGKVAMGNVPLFLRGAIACYYEMMKSMEAAGFGDNFIILQDFEYNALPQKNYGRLNGSGRINTGHQHNENSKTLDIFTLECDKHIQIGDFGNKGLQYNPNIYPGSHPDAIPMSELSGGPRYLTDHDFFATVAYLADAPSVVNTPSLIKRENGLKAAVNQLNRSRKMLNR